MFLKHFFLELFFVTKIVYLYHICMDNVCTIHKNVGISRHRFRVPTPHAWQGHMTQAKSDFAASCQIYCAEAHIFSPNSSFLSTIESAPLMLPGVTQYFHISKAIPHCTVQFVGFQWAGLDYYFTFTHKIFCCWRNFQDNFLPSGNTGQGAVTIMVEGVHVMFNISHKPFHQIWLIFIVNYH